MRGCIRRSLAVFVSTWLCSSVRGCIRQSLAVFVSTSLYSSVRRCIRESLAVFVSPWLCSSGRGCLKKNPTPKNSEKLRKFWGPRNPTPKNSENFGAHAIFGVFRSWGFGGHFGAHATQLRKTPKILGPTRSSEFFGVGVSEGILGPTQPNSEKLRKFWGPRDLRSFSELGFRRAQTGWVCARTGAQVSPTK